MQKLKVVFRILKWFFLCILSIIALVFLLLVCDGDYDSDSALLSKNEQNLVVSQKEYENNINEEQFKVLQKEFGKNKTLAKGFEIQCLLALSHYPELKETPIEFIIEPAFLPLASRPATTGILFPWVKRKYLVIISNETEDFFEPILLNKLPFNEQVGIIGHELAHTLHYKSKSALDILGIGYSYQYDNDFRINFERNTDKRAVSHGLGYQLVDFAYFVRRAFG